MNAIDTVIQADQAFAAGDLAQSEALYRQALREGSDNPAVAYNLGVLAARRKDWPEAIDWSTRAVQQAPDMSLAHYNLGTAYRQLGQLPAAAAALGRALQLQPDLHEARINLSLVLFAQGQIDDAIRLAHIALESHPDDPDNFANLASFLRAMGDNEGARLCAEAAIGLDPGHPGAWQNLGALAHDAQHYDEAFACYQRALGTDRAHAGSHFNLALSALAIGNYTLGWEEYEWRRQLPWMIGHYPAFGLPLWQGEPLAGKTLLILAEQGHGDTLQFVRLARQLHRPDTRLVLMAQPALCRLLARAPWLDRVISQLDPPPPADYVVSLMSLPHRLGITLDNIPAELPYLYPDPAEIAAWQQRLAGEKRPRVGLVWAGDRRPHDPEHQRIDSRRSMPLSAFSALLDKETLAWFSLQKGDAGQEAQAFPQISDFSGTWADFAATAAFVTEMDLVISVDTAVAHLAAALGRPTWLLSRHDACWRWLGNRADSPWYPKLRVFGQQKPGDWSQVVAQVGNALQANPPLRHEFIPGDTKPPAR